MVFRSLPAAISLGFQNILNPVALVPTESKPVGSVRQGPPSPISDELYSYIRHYLYIKIPTTFSKYKLLFLFNNYNKFFFEAVFEVQRSFIFDFFIQFYLAFPTNQHFYYITLAQKTENFCVIFFTRPCRGFVFLCFSVLGFVLLNFRCRLGRRFLILFWLGLGFRL